MSKERGPFYSDSEEFFGLMADHPHWDDPVVCRIDVLAQSRWIQSLNPSKTKDFETLKGFVNLLDDSIQWKAPLKEFMRKMEAGEYNGEFRYFANDRSGNVSQVGSLLSLIYQALNYNNK